MQIRSVGIDLGKTTFHLVALSATGKVLLRKKFTQKQLITFTANLQTSLIGMEACSGGWITAEWKPTENNRRAKFYSLTRAGRKALAEQAADWERLSSAVSQVLRFEEAK
jgi:transposase